MSANNIFHTRKKIESTEAYKSMSKMQRKVAMMRANVKAIENSLNVVEHIGFDQWKKQTNSKYLNVLIVKELCNDK